jgi:hypothetical protein
MSAAIDTSVLPESVRTRIDQMMPQTHEEDTYYCDLERYAGDPQVALSWTERDIEGRA